MKRYLMLACLASASILVSCKEEEKEKPKVSYDNNAKAKAVSQKADTSSVAIADLPIHITGTDYLIHPVGDLRIAERTKYDSGGSGVISYTISNYNEFEIAGFLRNMKFQQTGSDSLQVLTSQQVMIQSATYLKAFADKGKSQLLVYTLADMDTNKDGRIDSADIKSLYISTISGERFTKLSPDMQELINWQLIEQKDRLYFRTIEDANKNGAFDKEDVLHYNYVDLANKDWKVTAYQPLN